MSDRSSVTEKQLALSNQDIAGLLKNILKTGFFLVNIKYFKADDKKEKTHPQPLTPYAGHRLPSGGSIGPLPRVTLPRNATSRRQEPFPGQHLTAAMVGRCGETPYPTPPQQDSCTRQRQKTRYLRRSLQKKEVIGLSPSFTHLPVNVCPS